MGLLALERNSREERIGARLIRNVMSSHPHSNGSPSPTTIEHHLLILKQHALTPEPMSHSRSSQPILSRRIRMSNIRIWFSKSAPRVLVAT
jgi:hypothetical protein